MAIVATDIKNAIVANLVLGGREKTMAKDSAEHAFRLGLKLIWRMHDWSMSIKDSTLALTANQSTGYAVPDDCQAIIGIVRLTSNDYGYRLGSESIGGFDTSHPYVSQESANPVVSFKVEYDNATKKPLIYTYPKSDATVSARMLYKIKFNEQIVCALLHDDFEPLVMAAAIYQGIPSIGQNNPSERVQAFGEFKHLLNQYRMNDRLVIEELLSQYQFPSEMFYSTSSWQWILDAY
jgi:hypothetical protein